MHFPAGLVFLCALVSSAVALPHQYGMNAPRDWKGTPCNGTEKLCPEGFKCSWNKFCYSDLFSCQDANGSRLCHIEQSFCGNDTEICFTRKCEFDRDCPEGLLCGELGSCMFPSCEDGKCPGDFTCVEAQPDLLSCVRRRPTVGTPGELAPENLPVINHVCWPAHARVELESGRRVPMHTLALGDNVRVGPTSFSPVFMFTHRVADVVAEFVTLSTDVGTSVTLTPGHYIYANGQMVAARQVMLGDALQLADGNSARVVAKSSSMRKGLYNPQTIHGDIVVDGVRASTYTLSVEKQCAHALLFPLRTVYNFMGCVTSLLERGSTLARWAPRGRDFY